MDTGLADIMKDVRAASENIATAETRTARSLAELRKSSLDLESKYVGLESSVNDLWKRVQRSSAEGSGYDIDERKDAIACHVKHGLTIPKNDGHAPPYTPSASEVDEAMMATKAIRSLFRCANASNSMCRRLSGLARPKPNLVNSSLSPPQWAAASARCGP
jgi:hypothetical protein